MANSVANKSIDVPEELRKMETAIINLRYGMTTLQKQNITEGQNQKVKPLVFINMTDDRVKELKAEIKELQEKLKSEQFTRFNLEKSKVPKGLEDTAAQLKTATVTITEQDQEICEAHMKIKSLEVQLHKSKTQEALLKETLKENRALREESKKTALAISERNNQLKRSDEQLEIFLPIVQDYEKFKKLRDQLLQFAVNLKHSSEFQYKDIETYLEKLVAHIRKKLALQQQFCNEVLTFKATSKSSSLSTTQTQFTQTANMTPPSTSCSLQTLPKPRKREQVQISEESVLHSEQQDRPKETMELIEEQLAVIDNIQEQRNKLLEFAENMKDASKFQCNVADSPIVNHLEELEAHISKQLSSPPTVIYNTIEKFLRERQLESYISLGPETLPSSTSHTSQQSTAAQMSVSSTSFTLVASPLSTNISPVKLCSPQSITERQHNAISSSSTSNLPQPLSPHAHAPQNPKRITKKTLRHCKRVGKRRSLSRKATVPSDVSFYYKDGKAFTTKLDLESHIPKCTPARSFKCEECQKQFSRVGYLKRHLNKAHPKDLALNALETECECPSCGDRFATLELYLVHICPQTIQSTTDQSINDTSDSEDHCNNGNAVTGDVHIIRLSSDNFNFTPTPVAAVDDDDTDEEFVDIEH